MAVAASNGMHPFLSVEGRLDVRPSDFGASPPPLLQSELVAPPSLSIQSNLARPHVCPRLQASLDVVFRVAQTLIMLPVSSLP
mmetsp:Transcript_50260/g.132074  ORF Transcript_50260/g.132074 Transcript_50260/m.132074 type:complete len:83 (-) Transcript_50260:903-1151(-)